MLGSDDHITELFLMAELANPESRWQPYFQTLPPPTEFVVLACVTKAPNPSNISSVQGEGVELAGLASGDRHAHSALEQTISKVCTNNLFQASR